MQANAGVPVTVYWRPGCPYCARLRQDLRALAEDGGQAGQGPAGTPEP